MTAGRGYLTPETIPTAAICRRLAIPEDTLIIAAVSGALSELSYASNWQSFGAVTPQQMADRMSQMFTEYLETSACMIGLIMPFATTNPPPGTLRCDASIHNRVDFPLLYAALAAPYILSADTFITPDCRAKAVVGSGNYDGFDFTLYNFEGASAVILEEFQMPSHNHSIDLFITSLALAPGELPVQTDVLFNTVTGNTGGGQAHPNIQPTIVLDYCIIAR